MAVHSLDPRLTTKRFASVDPYGDALSLLKFWKDDGGVHLERRHVEAAARLTGASFGLLWDIILSPAVAR